MNSYMSLLLSEMKQQAEIVLEARNLIIINKLSTIALFGVLIEQWDQCVVQTGLKQSPHLGHKTLLLTNIISNVGSNNSVPIYNTLLECNTLYHCYLVHQTVPRD